MTKSKLVISSLLGGALLLCFSATTVAQKKEIQYKVEASAQASSESTLPFWLVSNRNGIIPDKKSERLYLGFNKNYNRNEVFDWTLGADAAISSGFHKTALVNQYYIGLKYTKIKLFLGAKNPEIDLDGLSFTNGNLIMAGNARPYPKIEIGSIDYINVPYTNGWLGVKAVLSNGWLLDDRYVSHVNLHHKNFFIRFGKEKGFSLEAGIDHYVQWTGISPVYGQLEGGLKAFAKILIAKEGAVLTTSNGGTSRNEADNSLGNHIGQNQVKLNYNLNKFSVSFFMKNMFEDRSGEVRKIYNVRDIYYGLHLKLHQIKIVKSILVEYYSSLHQGSDEIAPDGSVCGYDSYFNNSIYRSGWSNYHRGFGLPLNSPSTINDDNSIYFLNTSMKAFNFGFTGAYKKLQYLFKATMYKNYGQVYPVVNDKSLPIEDWTVRKEFTVDPQEYQKHFLLELSLPQNKIPFDISASFAYDSGDIYKENFGLMLKISRTGFISNMLKK
ncbi:capsule assembly Wzi family protein [Ancylomarina euxinus]|nr:capsule assembly Wzi family protein [Ancylomarina euxinus]MCZ4696334.1 hypothetical protein [Ancylomarina euxinus]